MEYKLLDIKKEDIYMIKDLWEKNRKFHQDKTQNFSYEYLNLNFEERMTNIFNSEGIKYKITGIMYKNNIIGYCLSIIQKNKGELCTLFILKEYRNKGLGQILVKEHLNWLQKNKCEDISVNVLIENIRTIQFYKILGFKENIISMKIPINKN